jgi:lipopolysaccharide transport system ATP-binding protein
MADQPALAASSSRSDAADAQPPTGLRITDLYFEDECGVTMSELRSGTPARLVIRYLAERPVDQLEVTFLVRGMAEEMRLILNLNSARDGASLSVPPGPGRVALDLPYMVLGPGLYVAKVLLGTTGYYVFDAVESYRFLVRADTGMNQCALYQPRALSLRVRKSLLR